MAEGSIDEARELFRSGRHEEAIRRVADVLQTDPEQVDARFFLGQLALLRSMYNDAITNFERVIAVEPTHLEAWGGAARAYQFRYHATCHKNPEARADLAAAIAAFRRAADLAPDPVEYLEELWLALGNYGQAMEGSEALRRADEFRATAPAYAELRSLGLRFLLSAPTPRNPSRLGFPSGNVGIGHISFLDMYAKLEQLGWIERKRTIVLAPREKVVNFAFLEYFKDYFSIVTDPVLIAALTPLAERLDRNISFSVQVRDQYLPAGFAVAAAERQWRAEGRPPLLRLQEDHRRRGWEALVRHGIPGDAWWVCLHVRERGFHGDQSGNEMNNCEINTYLPAIESITRRGGWVFRMGDPSMRPLPKMSRVVDYVHTDLRSDWMDVFLCAACRFFLGSGSGLAFVPHCFGVPFLLTNCIPLVGGCPFSPNALFLPKLLRRTVGAEVLSFAQMIASVPTAVQGAIYRQQGL